MELTLSLMLTGHLLCVNLSMVGPIFCIWLDIRDRRIPEAAGRGVAQQLARWSLAALLLGCLTGALLVAWNWLVGDHDFFRAATQLQSRIWWGVWELLFSIVFLGLYLLWWRLSRRRTLIERCGHHLLALLAATNLMYHFPPLFTILANLRSRGDPLPKVLSATDFRSLLFSDHVWAYTWHYWLTAVATTGIWIAAHDTLRPRTREHLNRLPALAVSAARLALVASLLQIPIGIWLITALPEPQQTNVLGGNTLVTFLFISALISAFGLIHHLAIAACGDASRPVILRSCGLLLVVIWLMCGTLIGMR